MRSGQWIATCAITAAVAAALTTKLAAQEVPALVDKQLPGLLTTYKGIHTAPELSHHEAQTSALLADELRKAGYTVTERVGKYPDGSQAYGARRNYCAADAGVFRCYRWRRQLGVV